MNKTVKYALFLLVIGIIAGGLLALVNSFTAPIIEERQRQAVMEALGEHFDYPSYSLDKAADYPERNSAIESIYYAFDEEDNLAAVIYKVSAKGYGGQVVTLVGIKADGTFDNAVVIEANNETQGIGSRVLEHDFGVKDENVNDYSYDTVSGATVSSGAVHTGIDVAAAHFKTIQGSLGGIKNE
ncbi:MAG TPA: FMN-binding protein [Bacilli bacterium]